MVVDGVAQHFKDESMALHGPNDVAFVGSLAEKTKQHTVKQDFCHEHEVDTNILPCTAEGFATLSMLTYNAMSLKSIVDQVAVEKMLVANNVHVAGFQETRDMNHEITDTAHFQQIHAAGKHGNFGCQLWIRKQSLWRLDTIAVRCQTPRLLRVMVNFECIGEFWGHVRQVIGSCGEGVRPIILVDANARFGGNQRRVPENRNACQLEMCVNDFALALTRHVDCRGRQVQTWVGFHEKPAKLDYIALSAELAASFITQGIPEQAEMLTEWDHRHLLASVHLPAGRVPRDQRLKLDRRAMSKPQNQQVAQQVFKDAPPCPWSKGVDEHLRVVHRHLQQQLATAFPLKPGRIKQPYISHKTWTLVRERNACRQVIRYLNQAWAKEVLHFMFHAWKSCRLPSFGWNPKGLGGFEMMRVPGPPNGHGKRIRTNAWQKNRCHHCGHEESVACLLKPIGRPPLMPQPFTFPFC